MKHQIFRFIFSVALCGLSVTATAYDAIIDGIYYSFFTEGEAWVTYLTNKGDNSSAYSGIVTIPESVVYNGTTNIVTGISSSAFKNCSELTKIFIPNTVKSIGEKAFQNCIKLSDIECSSSLTYIGNDAFDNTAWLKKQSDGIIYFANFVCGYKGEMPEKFSLNIKTGTIGIATYAFRGINKTISVNMPDGLAYINNYAFFECNGLCTIDIPGSVKTIGGSAFEGCENLMSANISYGVINIGGDAFARCTKLSSIVIPNSVTTIGARAFDECRDLCSLIVGTGVVSIEGYAFRNTRLAKVIWLPNTPPRGYRDALGSMNYVANDQYRNINSYYPSFIIYPYLSSIFEVDGVRYIPVSISDRTCDAVDCIENENYKQITIPSEVSYKGVKMTIRNIKPFICYNNKYIEELIFEGSTSIPEFSFYGCINIKKAVLGKVEKNTVGNDISLDGTMYISKSINSIDDCSFYGCQGLKNVIVEDRDTELKLGCNNEEGFFSSFKLDSVYIGGSINYNIYSPFYRNKSLRSVTISDKETTIYSKEFYGCTNLRNVKIGNSVSTIGNWAFSGCSSLDFFSFGSNVTSIGEEAFSDCTAMTRLISYATTPPACANQALDDINKWNCTLSVPRGSLSAYQQAEQWKEFFFTNDDASGINTIVNRSDKLQSVYDMNGTRIDNMKRGVIIIKEKDGTIKKVLAR